MGEAKSYGGPERRREGRDRGKMLTASEIATMMRDVVHEDRRDTFRLLGVDITDQKQVNALRSDLISAHNVRKAQEAGVSTFGKAVMLAIAGGLIALVVQYWKG